ncbi:helix-turn-helix transcriptional regulator [Paenibacillus paeoniae]|uniref:AraC family transcriptional regulator n=1 Tax=Paenibacillus paeoniae TaxID=2292705 RepID=A0A371PLH8_9BACL|nr:helix-turn-helix domain-containing protein [Paenibacillus paeoniae]REK77062.1 AraC family transcriptional regulator [Paenibacillus paeoniae]
MLSFEQLCLHQGMNWYEERSSHTPTAILVVMTYGKCVYWIDGEKLLLEKGDFMFIAPGVDYYAKSVPTVFHEQFVLTFRMMENFNEEGVPLLGSRPFTKAKAGCYEMMIERLRTVWKEWQENMPYVKLRSAALTLETLALWSRELQRGAQTSLTLQHADRMKAYIQDHYRGKVTKEHLGTCIGRSPNHAASLFRQTTGGTISEFVHSLRMRTAVYMLTESLLTVSEISDYLGYSDVTYFQRVFKRTLGHTPSAYLNERRQHV